MTSNLNKLYLEAIISLVVISHLKNIHGKISHFLSGIQFRLNEILFAKMNLVNITKHLYHLAQQEYGLYNATTSENETLAAQQLFQVLKSFEDSCFNDLYTYQSLEFNDEFDEDHDSEESNDENDENYDDDQIEGAEIQPNFTLEEMKNIIDWVDEHPNYSSSTILHRFRKLRSMNYISRFREYIERNGTRIEKVQQIKEFMLNEFYVKRQIEKATVHDRDLELFSIQKARELGWEDFKGSISFVKSFKKENRISSRKYTKLITRTSSKKTSCSLPSIGSCLNLRDSSIRNIHSF